MFTPIITRTPSYSYPLIGHSTPRPLLAVWLTILILAFGNVGSAFAQTYSVIKQFSPDEGGSVRGELLVSKGVFYGAAQVGGTNFLGTLFKMNTDGSGFTVLRHLAESDGILPDSGLLLSASTLYGTAPFGGSSNQGTIFQIDTNGSGFSVLRHFTGHTDDGTPNDDGANPAKLLQDGSVLYGTTSSGGNGNFGTIFKINTNGTGYTILKHFTGGSDGSFPQGGLILAGGVLYGVTTFGGTADAGTVFRINTNGTGYQILKNFASGAGNGAAPAARLLLSGSTLYGTTQQGGASELGTVFKIGTNGSDFAVLKEFAGGSSGASPVANLLLFSNILYGTTQSGGNSEQGTVFQVGTDGSGFAVIKHFIAGTNEGSFPAAGLVMPSGSLFGTTPQGGDWEQGTLFRLKLFEDNRAPTNITLSNATIAENNTPNFLVGTLSATDADNGQTHVYTLVSDFGDNSAFTITGSNLRINVTANYEIKTSYSIRIRTTDNGSPVETFEKQFSITISNVNEVPADISLSNATIVDENAPHATVGTLSATDPDSGQTHVFTLVNDFGDNSAFTITGSNLTINASTDYETKNSYSIRVRATDNGSPSLAFEKQFAITVTIINQAPSFTLPPPTPTPTPNLTATLNGFNAPIGLVFDEADNLYVANFDGNTIQKVTPGGNVSIFASGFKGPDRMAFDRDGNLYVPNYRGSTVSKVTPGGVVSTVASGFNLPAAVALDEDGNLYVANADGGRISKVTPGGVVSTFASGFSMPYGLAIDPSGNHYVADSDRNTVSKVTPAGVVTTFASGFKGSQGLAFDKVGNLYVANYSGNTVSKVTPAGVVTTFASGFNKPFNLAFDKTGNLYVANTAGNSVYKYSTGLRVPPGAGSQVVQNFATNILPGPANETGQTVSFTVTTDNDAFFLNSVKPTIDNSASGTPGTLRYTPAANASGTVTVTVIAKDNAGTANGGVDSSPAQAFSLTAAPNTAPSVTFSPKTVTIPENGAAQTLPSFATFSSGFPNELGQTLVGYTVTVDTTDNASLFSTSPAIDNNGTLTFTAANGQSGTSTIKVVVQDNGGTVGGGLDKSTNTFTLAVVPSQFVVTNTSQLAAAIANAAASGTTILLVGNVDLSSIGAITKNLKLVAGTGATLTGTLQVGSGGNVNLGGGTFPGASITVKSGGTLSGSGSFSGTLLVESGATVAPGTSPGTISANTGTWAGGAIYEWEINDATEAAGSTDLMVFTNSLTISATAANRFIVRVNTLTALNQPGLLPSFNPEFSYTWKIAQAGSVVGFDASAFTVDITGVANNLAGGRFSIQQSAGSVFLTFTPAGPRLTALPGSGNMTISWKEEPTIPLILQSALNMTDSWTTVTNQSTFNNGTNYLTVPTTGSRQFYQLKSSQP